MAEALQLVLSEQGEIELKKLCADFASSVAQETEKSCNIIRARQLRKEREQYQQIIRRHKLAIYKLKKENEESHRKTADIELANLRKMVEALQQTKAEGNEDGASGSGSGGSSVPIKPPPPPVEQKPKLECGKCQEKFGDYQVLQRHVTYECMQPFKCQDCGRCLASVSSLIQHTQRMHQVKRERRTTWFGNAQTSILCGLQWAFVGWNVQQ